MLFSKKINECCELLFNSYYDKNKVVLFKGRFDQGINHAYDSNCKCRVLHVSFLRVFQWLMTVQGNKQNNYIEKIWVKTKDHGSLINYWQELKEFAPHRKKKKKNENEANC